MLNRKTLLASLALLGSLALASGAAAQTLPAGNGTLAGGERIRVKGCGREAGPVTLGVSLAANGDWTITEGANTYTGTATATTNRLARLTPSAGTLALLETNLESEASGICEETVTISALTANGALKVNKRGDRARVFVLARGEGSSASGTGRGSYRLRTRGAWTLAQP
jgi:hypothetical protein